MKQHKYLIALIGPAGSGKSTVVQKLATQYAQRLNTANYALSGGMFYRLFAYFVERQEIPWEEDRCEGLLAFAAQQTIRVSQDGTFLVNDVEVSTAELKTESISILCSKIAQFLHLRKVVESLLQEAIDTYNGDYVFFDGRTLNEALSPEHTLLALIYLDCNPEAAAIRTLHPVQDIIDRNQRDRYRLEEAHRNATAVIDTSTLTLEQVLTECTNVIDTQLTTIVS